jgi:hypothetical protein
VNGRVLRDQFDLLIGFLYITDIALFMLDDGVNAECALGALCLLQIQEPTRGRF